VTASDSPSPAFGFLMCCLRTFVACVASLPFAGCSPGPRPSVVLITIDTLRADRLGCYGYEGAETPNLDRLASEGVLFEQVGAQVPVTLPSHATILTGLLPASHGVHDNSTFSLNDTVTTIAEVFRQAGYRTGAVLGAYVLARQFGLDQGFEDYQDWFAAGRDSGGVEMLEQRASEVARQGMEWLDRRRGERFFLWLHFFDPHRPYDPPPPFAERFTGREYDGEVAYVDAHIGSLLAHLADRGLDRSTLVVVVSDHGEGLGEHDESTHGYFVYESTMRVPLLLRWPGRLRAGLRVSEVVRTADIAPTVIGLAGLRAPRRRDGIDLAPSFEDRLIADSMSVGEALSPLYDFGLSPLVSVRTNRWKYIAGPTPALHDLAVDPSESRNVAEAHPDVADELAEVAWVYAARLSEERDGAPTIPEEERRKLLALGYLSSPRRAIPDVRRWPDLEDPRDHAALIAAAMDAMALITQGNQADAVPLLERLPVELRNRPLLLQLLGWALRQALRYDEAAEVLRRGVALDSSYASLWTLLGEVELLRANYQDAIEALDRALGLIPFDAWTHYLKGRALLAMDRAEESRRSFRAAARLRPSLWEAQLQLARLLLSAGEPDSALPHASLAALHSDGSADAHELMGNCFEARGAWREAAGAYGDAVSADSSRTALYKRIALCYHRTGMEDEAAGALRQYSARHGEESGVLSILAGWSLARGDTIGALTGWERAVELDSANAGAWAGLITLAAARHGLPAAARLADRAVAACPGDVVLRRLADRITAQARG
jgi:arylsulfatase A-like enzyme/tetratricopeptide (TPR) repeat protein